jgi:hypothetical protein
LAVEDTAALAGFAPAATGVLVRQLGGPARSDAIASLVIGLRLGVTATGLAWPLADLLIGRSLPPDRLRQARDIRAVPGVDEVLDVSRPTWRRRRPCSQRRRIRRPRCSPVGWTSTRSLRRELPAIGEVFIDVTRHRRRRA